MKNIPWVPITGVMGAFIIGGLIYLICTLDNAVMAQYNKTIHDLCASDESLDNEVNVLEAYPELAAVKQKMMQVHHLNLRKQDFFRNPAPIYSQRKAEAMVCDQKEINVRGGEISILLDNFSTQMRLFTQNK